jgi:hypothetical protein
LYRYSTAGGGNNNGNGGAGGGVGGPGGGGGGGFGGGGAVGGGGGGGGGPGEVGGFDDRERAACERTVACQILPGVTDASPLVRTETAVGPLYKLNAVVTLSLKAPGDPTLEPMK